MEGVCRKSIICERIGEMQAQAMRVEASCVPFDYLAQAPI